MDILIIIGLCILYEKLEGIEKLLKSGTAKLSTEAGDAK